jgi:hypothetical protein
MSIWTEETVTVQGNEAEELPTNRFYDAFSPSAFNRQDGFFQGQEKIPIVDDDGCYEQAEDARCKKIQAFDGTGWRYMYYEGDADDDDSL